MRTVESRYSLLVLHPRSRDLTDEEKEALVCYEAKITEPMVARLCHEMWINGDTPRFLRIQGRYICIIGDETCISYSACPAPKKLPESWKKEI